MRHILEKHQHSFSPDDSWTPVTEESLEYAVLDSSPLRMEYSETLAKRWKDVTSMFELARKSRALSKEQHPKLEAMRQEREELYQKEMEAQEDEIETANPERITENMEEKIIEDDEFGDYELSRSLQIFHDNFRDKKGAISHMVEGK